MAKIVLRDGTDGARTKIIARLKVELTKAFLHDTSTLTLGASLSNSQIEAKSSDTTYRTRNLQFTPSTTIFQTQNNLQQIVDNDITLFYLLNGRPVNKIALGKQDGLNFVVGGYITIPTLNPAQNTAHFIREIKIEVLDQA